MWRTASRAGRVRDRERIGGTRPARRVHRTTIRGVDELVELLGRHRPERAARVGRLLAGPEPDAVLVVGPDEASVARLTLALAARLPAARLLCAPAHAAVRASWVRDTRAVVWLGDPSAPPGALLAELAGQVDAVHLVAAPAPPGGGGTEAPPGGSARDGAGMQAPSGDRGGGDGGGTGPAPAVPRLAGQPWHALPDPSRPPDSLLGALTATAGSPARRAALRMLRDDLGELLAAREGRRERAELHRLATERALRGRREQLTARRLDATAHWSRRLRTDLAAARLDASAELADGLSRLRAQSAEHLPGAGRLDRARFPDRLAGAGDRLAAQLCARFDQRVAALEELVRADLGAAPVRATPASPAPRCTPPPSRDRRPGRVLAVVLVSALYGMARLAGGGTSGSAPVLLAGAAVAGVGWLEWSRRGGADRDALATWTAELLAELRGRADAALADRALAAERRLAALVDTAAAARVAVLDDQLRDQDGLARACAARLAEHRELDRTAVAELRHGCARLDALLDPPQVTDRTGARGVA
jgi:hypothetical protein